MEHHKRQAYCHIHRSELFQFPSTWQISHNMKIQPVMLEAEVEQLVSKSRASWRGVKHGGEVG